MWDDRAFVERVLRRSEQLGRPLPSKLRGRLSKKVDRGRRIDTIIEVAQYLDWSLAEALGVQPDPRVLVINENTLARAIRAAEQIVQARGTAKGGTPSALAAEIAAIYKLLATRDAAGLSTSEADLNLVVSSRLA